MVGIKWPNLFSFINLYCKKNGKNIFLKKPGKTNLPKSSAFCFINLLSTLRKVMELVIIERTASLAEKFGLLLTNLYKAFKQKSIIDRLLIVQEKVYQA